MRSQELAVERRRVVARGGATQRLQARRRQESARALAVLDRDHEAQLLGERPEQQRKRLAFGFERGDGAHDARRLVAVDRVDQRVALEARDVGDGAADRLERDLAFG